MDKNFFRFDIDDEILSEEFETAAPNLSDKKVQNTTKTTEKSIENGFLCLKTLKNTVKKPGYEKNINSNVKKKSTQEFCKVDDYVNFDFKTKAKQLEEKLLIGLNEKISQDEEVQDVLERAHIGVIYF